MHKISRQEVREYIFNALVSGESRSYVEIVVISRYPTIESWRHRRMVGLVYASLQRLENKGFTYAKSYMHSGKAH